MIKKIIMAFSLLLTLSSNAATLQIVGEYKNIPVSGNPGQPYGTAFIYDNGAILQSDYIIIKDVSNTAPTGILYAPYLLYSARQDARTWSLSLKLNYEFVPTYPPEITVLVLRVLP